jgi:RHS repeat-associated protein
LAVDFPAGDATVFGEPPAFRNGPPSWYGSLITGMTDGSGYQYKRNRYYDPTTGQFTQEDPIGLAGGLNVYGYANGDPATYSDPFGLDPDPEKTARVAIIIMRAASALATLINSYLIPHEPPNGSISPAPPPVIAPPPKPGELRTLGDAFKEALKGRLSRSATGAPEGARPPSQIRLPSSSESEFGELEAEGASSLLLELGVALIAIPLTPASLGNDTPCGKAHCTVSNTH